MDTATTIPVDVIQLPERCYRCGDITAPVIGLRFGRTTIRGDDYEMYDDGGGWFLEYDYDSAAIVAAACSDDVLAVHGAGPIEWRTTRVIPDGYLANTCHHCGAVLGNWPLHEAFIEFQAEGGTLDHLPHFCAAIPSDLLQQL